MWMLIHNRDQFVAMAPAFGAKAESWRTLELSLDGQYRFDPVWFAEHAGHELVPRDEYGRYADQCAAYVRCGACGEPKRCTKPLDHSDDHVRSKVYSPETIAAYAKIIETGMEGSSDEMLVALRHLAMMVHCDFTGELRAPHTHIPERR